MPFIHSFILSSSRLLTNWFIRSFIQSFIHSFINSLTRSFFHSLTGYAPATAHVGVINGHRRESMSDNGLYVRMALLMLVCGNACELFQSRRHYSQALVQLGADPTQTQHRHNTTT
eukprot:GHVU01131407.1.p1 GENE.GHVU01131407.1~~GHVU01131407.1.p1  ORF type:complete len:116 (-),score=1.20 GHVU01131407.1:169-516(-)